MSDTFSFVTLPIETDRLSAQWAVRIVGAVAGETSEPTFDLDIVERMVQAIRNEAAREVYAQLATDLSADLLERAFKPSLWGDPR